MPLDPDVRTALLGIAGELRDGGSPGPLIVEVAAIMATLAARGEITRDDGVRTIMAVGTCEDLDTLAELLDRI
ncbi:hypothetical protein [Stackebrandtia soli]|uniref:hypothetical protein n=1 Tax=Stackebrandtia soli TaxID=1892856 RepID=UPI0039E87BDD